MFKLKIPPPIYMLLTASLMWMLNQWLPIVEVIEISWRPLGYLAISMALVIDGLSLIKFIRSRTSINPMRPEGTEILVVSGMYQYSRNPMYVGLLFLLSGWAILLGSLSPFILLPLFVWTIFTQQIQPEEKILGDKFGAAYVDYKKSVRRWI